MSYDGRKVDKSFVMIMTMIDLEWLIGQYFASILAKVIILGSLWSLFL